MEEDELWNSYLYEGTNVLKNNFGIKDYHKLKEIESTISFEKLLKLNIKPLDLSCDKEHLKKIHEYIFKDIYPFAGQYRIVNISKEIGTFLNIKDEYTIDKYIDNIFKEAKIKEEKCYSKYDFSFLLGFLYTSLIYCHPFRDGNGRAIREFIREYSIKKSKELLNENLELDWRLVDKKELNKHLDVAHLYPAETGLLLYNALVQIKPKDKRTI